MDELSPEPTDDDQRVDPTTDSDDLLTLAEADSTVRIRQLWDDALPAADARTAALIQDERRQIRHTTSTDTSLGSVSLGAVGLAEDEPVNTRRIGRAQRVRAKAELRRADLWVDPVTDTYEVGSTAERIRFDLETFDHGEPDEGGQTEHRNLGPLCALHHRLKTFGGWSSLCFRLR